MKISQLVVLWQKEVNKNAKEIDQFEERDWYSLAIGWALGKGETIKNACAFAYHIRYHTNMWG